VRDRLITLACALGSLLVFAALFVRSGAEVAPVALPTTVERHGNGLRGVRSWLAGEGLRSLSLRERFDTLAKRTDLPAIGNLLIVSMPVATPFRATEARALDRWIRSGNTLLVLACLSDRPEWGMAGAAAVVNDLQLLTGLDFEALPGRAPVGASAAAALAAARPLSQPQRHTLLPNRPHPYLRGVSNAVGVSDYPPHSFTAKIPRDGFVLSLAHERETGAGLLWVRAAGAGTVIVSGFGSLLSNRTLALADNARLLANLVASTVSARGAVLFDDEHQGLSDTYDPAKFYADPRLYRTIGVLAAVWLCWVLGGTRLRLPASRVAAPREAELVRATGVFLARVLSPAAAARRMFEHFFRRLAVRLPRTTLRSQLPWDWLEHHPRLPRAEVRQLREWYERAYSERRVPLARLHNLIVRIERQLAA